MTTHRSLLLYGITPAVISTLLALTAPHTTDAAAAGAWVRPLSGRPRISEPYGVRGHWKAGHHTGVDFAVPAGTAVASVGPGTVVLAKRHGAYGKAVTIHMTDGHYTLFGHLSRISVRVGRRVRAGTRVGYSGSTGRATGPHLHFEVRTRRGYGSDTDPLAYLARHGVRAVARGVRR
ncbi:M23 family metallopeptidase [Streptomyces sp. MST-110588]|uniref:M23 family metallopeptidase n=1 Tax=Streptomyces sp. MST-110588 TaxID=2833628 RepID=UPI001F5D5DB2|nr:M23 family metallopeptidase [Streptomyces sp. MST-110588]UNO41542.1 M23 family metallopeptidase [Streptomyces sp. MST-110588]